MLYFRQACMAQDGLVGKIGYVEERGWMTNEAPVSRNMPHNKQRNQKQPIFDLPYICSLTPSNKIINQKWASYDTTNAHRSRNTAGPEKSA